MQLCSPACSHPHLGLVAMPEHEDPTCNPLVNTKHSQHMSMANAMQAASRPDAAVQPSLQPPTPWVGGNAKAGDVTLLLATEYTRNVDPTCQPEVNSKYSKHTSLPLPCKQPAGLMQLCSPACSHPHLESVAMPKQWM